MKLPSAAFPAYVEQVSGFPCHFPREYRGLFLNILSARLQGIAERPRCA